MPGHQPRRGVTLRAAADKPATLTLKPARPTTGRVVDENDKPVGDAQILLLRDHESFYPNARLVTKTDADGKFILDQLADQQLSTMRVDVANRPRLVLTNVEAGKTDQVWKLKPSLKSTLQLAFVVGKGL